MGPPVTAKILYLDIETFPEKSYTWGRRKQWISAEQVIESGRVAAVAAKWHDGKTVMWFSEFHCEGGSEQMIRSTWSLLDEADVVVHFNGKAFDIPWLHTEFLKLGLLPPSPYKQIDLYQVAKRVVRLPSYRLKDVLLAFNLPTKSDPGGFKTWAGCMAGDARAWATLRRYGKQDVVVLQPLYELLRAWSPGLPNMGLWSDEEHSCPACGGTDLRQEGRALTTLGAYQRYQCRSCGKWSRGKKAIDYVELRGAA